MNFSPASKFTLSSKSRPCAVCGNVTGHCKTKDGDRGDLLHYCHNHPSKPQGPIAGHYWTAAGGGWGIFTTEKPAHQGSTRSKAKADGAAKTIPAVSPADRDAAFTAYMAGLTLHPDDRADLIRRGVTDEQIAEWGVVSVEGKEPGYLCPCYSPEGLVLGAQWRLRDASEGARYKWVSWIGGGSKNGDELPLTVHRPIDGTPTGIAVCEGIGAKSFILAQRSGMVAIGAGSDSQFVSSPLHWQSYLSALSIELNCNTLIFYPDSGAVQNASVMGKYSQWFESMARLGYQVKIAWWGQTVKGESPDPDELTDDIEVSLITVAEFEAMAEPQAAEIGEIPWKCLPSHHHQIGIWKTIEVPVSAVDLIQRNHDRASSDPNLQYVGAGLGKEGPIEIFREFDPQMNLDFVVTKMIASPDGGMIELKVTQKQGARTVKESAIIRSTDTTKVDQFVNALKKAIGRNIICSLKPNHLQALLQNRTAQYQIAGGKTFNLAPRTGRQENGYFVFENIQFDPQGRICTENESGYIFNRDLGIDEQVVSPKVAPQNNNAIANLINAAAAYYHPDSFPLALMTMGYGAASVHRAEIMHENSNFPQMAVFGDAGGGKTLAATMACSFFGTQIAPITQFSESVIYETVKSIGSLLLMIDDPLKKEKRGGVIADKVDNFTWSMYGGAARKVRHNEQKPFTNVIITSNKALGEGTSAIESRLIKLSFPVRKFNDFAKQDLSDAIRSASGGLGQLIGMKFDIKAIRQTARNLTPYLTGAHARLTDSYAILVHYTQRLCDMAGYAFNALDYCIKHLCPAAESFDSDKDSLTDFLEKLATMRSEGVVGEWNMTQVVKAHKPYLAVQLHAIWPEFEKRFQVNYSRQSIEALIVEREGITGSTQRFAQSKQAWLDYLRALAQYEMGLGKLDLNDVPIKPSKPKKTAQSKCVLIPATFVDAAGGGEGATNTNYSDNIAPAWEPPTPEPEESIVTHNDIKPGDVVTIVNDHPEADITAGDDVIIVSVVEDAVSGWWFATVQTDNEKPPISVWLTELQINKPDSNEL